MQHGNRKAVINDNGKSIGVKVRLVRLVTGVGCTSNESDVQRVSGGQTSSIIIDTR